MPIAMSIYLFCVTVSLQDHAKGEGVGGRANDDATRGAGYSMMTVDPKFLMM